MFAMGQLVPGLGASLVAQQLTSGSTNAVSPYSYFGLGDLSDPALSRNYGMGSLSIASFDRFNVNSVNPANLADLTYTSVELTFNYRLNDLRTQTEGAYFRSGGLSGFEAAFPTRKNLVFAMGLTPISAIGYDVEQVRAVTDGSTTEVYQSRSIADGGLSSVHLSAARRFLRNRLSVGLSARYYFGSLAEQRTTSVLGGSIAVYNINDTYSGFSPTLGINFADSLRSTLEYFRVGFSLRFPTQISVASQATGFATFSDSLTTLEDRSTTVTLPTQLSFGLAYTIGGKYSVGLEAHYEDWSAFRYFERQQSLDSRIRVNLGTEWIPVYNSSRFFHRMNYRAGLRYENSHLNFNGRSIDLMSFTLGMGIPISRNFSMINLAATAGRRGTLTDGLIRENFFQFVIGLNFTELWFVKRRYD